MVFRKPWLVMLVVTVFGAGVGCDGSTGSTVQHLDPDRDCALYAFAKAANYKRYIEECSATPGERGPVLYLSLYFNCRRHDQHVDHEQYRWAQCLNGVVHPSRGHVELFEGSGCILTSGECRIDPDALASLPMIELDPTKPETIVLQAAYARLAELRARIMAEGGPTLRERLQALNAAELFSDVALEAFRDQEEESGIFALSSALGLIDLAADFVPGTGLFRDGVIVITGINPITGESVSATGRALTAGTLLVPGFLVGSAKGIARLSTRLDRIADSGKRTAGVADDLRRSIQRADDEVERLVRGVPC